MNLEQTIGLYEINSRELIGEVYTGGLEMYFRAPSLGGPLGPRAPSAPFGREISGPSVSPFGGLDLFRPVNPILDGGLTIDLGKSTSNTTILKESIGPIRNTYIHHDDGFGRMTSGLKDLKNVGVDELQVMIDTIRRLKL